MNDTKEPTKEQEVKITVAGVTFSASEVESAVIKIGERKIQIFAKEEEQKKVGF